MYLSHQWQVVLIANATRTTELRTVTPDTGSGGKYCDQLVMSIRGRGWPMVEPQTLSGWGNSESKPIDPGHPLEISLHSGESWIPKGSEQGLRAPELWVFYSFSRMRQRQPRWLSCVWRVTGMRWVYKLSPSNFSYIPSHLYIIEVVCLQFPFRKFLSRVFSLLTQSSRQETISEENPSHNLISTHPSTHLVNTQREPMISRDTGVKHTDSHPGEMCSQLGAKNNTMR